MLARNSLAMIVISLLPMTVALAQGETIEEVKKQITDKNKAIKTLRADMTMVSEIASPQYSMKSEGTGTYEYKREGDTIKTRTDSTTKATTTVGDMEQKSNQEVLTVSNGEIAYSYSDTDGQRYVQKMKIPQEIPDDPIGEMEKDFNLKRLPDEKVDGHDTFVLEMTPKTESAQQGSMNKMLQYYRKDIGLLVKMVIFGPDDKPMATTEYTNVEIDVPIDDSRFEFTPPEGVQVIDMSEMAQQQP